MIGSPTVAAFIGFWGFWVLLAMGVVRGDLALRGSVVFVADIALVLAVFKGDVRLT